MPEMSQKAINQMMPTNPSVDIQPSARLAVAASVATSNECSVRQKIPAGCAKRSAAILRFRNLVTANPLFASWDSPLLFLRIARLLYEEFSSFSQPILLGGDLVSRVEASD
jgi:hypothetical protein